MSRSARTTERIVRDFDTAAKLREIKEWDSLREGLAVRFAEMMILAGLFCFSFAILITLVFVLPQANEGLYDLLLLFIGGWVMMVVISLEFLIRKFRVLRRVAEINNQRLRRLERLHQKSQKPEATEEP